LGRPIGITSPAPFEAMNLTSSPSEIEEVWRRGVTDMNPKDPKAVEEMQALVRAIYRLRSDITWLNRKLMGGVSP